MHVYTDGSCFRSEKKAGAGVYLANFASSANAKEYLSFPLGDASNNVAELEGILKAMQHLLPRVANIQRVYFFVDNKYAINVSTKVWKAKCHRPLVRQIHLTLASLLKLTQVFFLWVPAHAMIYGNEVADYLAKRGAKAASFSSCPPDQKCLNDLLSNQASPSSRRLPARPTPPHHPATPRSHPSSDAISKKYTHAQDKPHQACWC
jgi:ribonuclease HI